MLKAFKEFLGIEPLSAENAEYAIINVDSDDEYGDVLQYCRTNRSAQKAQKKWYDMYVWHGGPRTFVKKIN